MYTTAGTTQMPLRGVNKRISNTFRPTWAIMNDLNWIQVEVSAIYM